MRALPIFFVACAFFFPPLALGEAARETARAEHGMVASASRIASQVGVDVLKRGGNAVDAAVAVGLALAVTFPEAGNIGGGGFMLVRMNDGRAVAIDYRETAPAAARADLYLDSKGELIPGASTEGYRAVGVPGTIAGFALALKEFGTISWAEAIEPARKLAEEGFPVPAGLAQRFREIAVLTKFPESRRIFLNNGDYFRVGDTLRQPELAATLKRLRDEGPREFYEGQTAQLIVDDMKANNGLITLDDLRAYKPVMREPLRGAYRGREIITMPPPSSGGIAILQMLNMLETFDLASIQRGSVARHHLMVEIMRRAFADRAEFLGDPDFVKVPTKGLTAKAYAAELGQTINRERATPSAKIGHGDPGRYESPQTTHFSIVDRTGNAVSNTITLNTEFGCGATVRGAGFLLNNEMDDFTSKVGAPNAYGLIQSEKNAIAPNKRPLSSMTPTIVLDNGKLFMVVGTPGGPTIINNVLQMIVSVIDDRMDLQKAVDAPRIHHQWLPDEIRYDTGAFSDDVRSRLAEMGHEFERRARAFGDVNAVMIDPASGVRLGAADSRNSDGAALGH